MDGVRQNVRTVQNVALKNKRPLKCAYHGRFLLFFFFFMKVPVINYRSQCYNLICLCKNYTGCIEVYKIVLIPTTAATFGTTLVCLD